MYLLRHVQPGLHASCTGPRWPRENLAMEALCNLCYVISICLQRESQQVYNMGHYFLDTLYMSKIVNFSIKWSKPQKMYYWPGHLGPNPLLLVAQPLRTFFCGFFNIEYLYLCPPRRGCPRRGCPIPRLKN